MRTRSLILLGLLAATPACGGDDNPAGADGGGTADPTPALYPNLAELYGGEQGIYRGCGPNGGVCHSSREYPNLATMGSIVGQIGRRCNEKRDDPATIDDLCERPGDLLAIDDARAEIGSLVAMDAEKLRWRVTLAGEIASVPRAAKVKVVRNFDDGPVELYDFTGAVGAEPDPGDKRAVFLVIETPSRAELAFLQDWFGHAGVPGDPGSLQVGDANRNGVFGATLGGALIRPGAPDKSYLLKRLLDPEAGPVMPRANCCHWTKSSLRALWCWVAGLTPDGGNAMDPIAYGTCPPLPGGADQLLYPEPGPQCETSGMCPVRLKMSWPEGAPPTFTNIYRNVLAQSCGGATSCHDAAQPGAGLSMRSESDAYRDLVQSPRKRVVPGRPGESLLVKRISPDLCMKPDCVTMPLDRPTLDKSLRDIITTWIENGARP